MSRIGRRPPVTAFMATILLAALTAAWGWGQTPELSPPGTDSFPKLQGLEELLGDLPADSGPPVKMSARFLVEATGRRGILQVAANIAPDWHLYSVTQQPGGPVTSRIVLTPSDQYQLTGEFEPDKPPTVLDDGLFPVPQEYHEERVVWSAPITLSTGVDPKQLMVTGHLVGQACQESGSCLPLSSPATMFEGSYAGEAQVASAGDSASPTTSAAASLGTVPATGAVTATSAGTAIYYLAAAFLAGLILNLMPCVLPVIGLKIMSFAQQAGESPLRVFLLNLVFVVGLISVFMVLAFLAAFFGWGWGRQFQRPEFSIALVSVVFVFALSFLGIWEIPIPGFMGAGKTAELSQREGLTGAFFKGVLTTMLATPCGGPLIVPTLAWAVRQPTLMIFATFGFMGLGMGLPYLLFGIFPKLMTLLLPRPGAWMETFKQVMGFFLLATVVWIFSFIDKDYFVPTLALLFALWAACWAIGRVPMTAQFGIKLRTYLASGGFAAILGYLAFTMMGPQDATWDSYTRANLDSFRNQGVAVLVDFTADW